MAMSQRSASSQGQFRIPTDRTVISPGHPFYERILPRLLIHAAGFNLAPVMRRLFGRGTPRGLWDLVRGLLRSLLWVFCRWITPHGLIRRRICNTIHPLQDSAVPACAA